MPFKLICGEAKVAHRVTFMYLAGGWWGMKESGRGDIRINSSHVSVGGVGNFIFLCLDFLSGGFSEAIMDALAIGLGDQPSALTSSQSEQQLPPASLQKKHKKRQKECVGDATS